MKPKLDIVFNQNEPSRYSPQLSFLNEEGKDSGVTRRYLKVLITNQGRAVARHCYGTVELLAWNPIDVRHAPHDRGPIQLLWDTNNLFEDVPARRGYRLLHIAFTDSRTNTMEGDYRAFFSTSDGIMKPTVFLAQDSLGQGEFQIRIIVTSEKGDTKTRKFRIHTSGDWQDCYMEPIS